jgi:hypothetical protein
MARFPNKIKPLIGSGGPHREHGAPDSVGKQLQEMGNAAKEMGKLPIFLIRDS